MEKIKVLVVAAEAVPYANVGGFSSVVRYLSRALCYQGQDVRIFMPKYGTIDEEKFPLETIVSGLKVPTDDAQTPYLICNVKKRVGDDGVIAYFLENQEYYEKRANVYGYSDDPTRWALLSRGAIEFIKVSDFVPDVIHCNDWHTGIIPDYLAKNYADDTKLATISTVFTIHNLSIQGYNLDHNHVSEVDFDDGRSFVAGFFDPRLAKQNFMRRGILYADVLSTVSKQYAKEILTPEFGQGLDKLLLELRSKLFGIVNGLDYEEFNPMTDSLIKYPYSLDSPEERSKNKPILQEEFDLPVDDTALLLGFVGRLDFQKGVDLIVDALSKILNDYNIQFVHVGGGDSYLADMLRNLKSSFPTKVGIHPYANFTLPRKVFAGADCILVPSRFEPCGIVQIEALRYGAIPIVRKVGGLADTVQNFNSSTKEGNGIVFTSFDTFSLFGAIVRAYELFQNKDIWRKLIKNSMLSDYSWDYSAKEYIKLYELSRQFKLNPQKKIAESFE